MVNVIWLFLIVIGGATGILTGKAALLTQAVLSSAQAAVTLVIGLVGVMALWSGIMKIAEESGLADMMGGIVRPFVRLLFPGIPPNHPAVTAITLSVVANLLGMGNAATPLGLKAMNEMQKLNRKPGTATDAMCTFVILTLSGIVLVPTTVLAIRAQHGSHDPAIIVGPLIFLTSSIMALVLILDWILRNLFPGE